MKTKRSPLERSAINWWKGRRPLSYTHAEHLRNPTVNAGYRESSQKLAAAVGKHLRKASA
jgi:hypothetical protein